MLLRYGSRFALLAALGAGGYATAAETAKSAHAKAPAAGAPTIVLRGDHCTLRALGELVKSFEASRQGKVTLQPFSTVSGLDAVAAGTADVAASARPAMPDRPEEQGTNFYPVAWDALVPIVAAGNPVGNISLKQLHDVYLGRITNWKELGGADAPINLDGVAAPLDGVEYSTRLLLFHFGDQQVSVSRLYLNVEKLEEDIALNEHGLGMTTLSGVAHNPKVKMLTVEGVRASPATIADGSYPLYTALYLAARDDDRQHETVAKLIEFTGSDGAKALLRKRDLVPYADAADLIARQDARVAYIDAHVRPEAATSTSTSTETPVSAPRATAQALERVAPTSERTLEAKERADRAAAEKAEKAKAAAEQH
jgi:phosphate transport system substrate-binding protein